MKIPNSEALATILNQIDILKGSVIQMHSRSDYDAEALQDLELLSVVYFPDWKAYCDNLIREREVIFKGQHGKVKL